MVPRLSATYAQHVKNYGATQELLAMQLMQKHWCPIAEMCTHITIIILFFVAMTECLGRTPLSSPLCRNNIIVLILHLPFLFFVTRLSALADPLY